MLTKFQERWYVLFVLLDVATMARIWMRQMLRDLLDILIALVYFLSEARTLKNKLYALLLVSCTLPVILLEGDATATVVVGIIAVPMFFAKKNWIY